MSLFYHLYLIGKILGEPIPIKFIMTKCSVGWHVAGEVSFVDMGNGFSLVKLTNELDCNRVFESPPWFVEGQVYCLQRWKKDFDHVTEKLVLTFLWVRIPRLPLEVWSESGSEKIVRPMGKIYKIDTNTEVIAKGLFTRVCLAVDISKPLRKRLM